MRLSREQGMYVSIFRKTSGSLSYISISSCAEVGVTLLVDFGGYFSLIFYGMCALISIMMWRAPPPCVAIVELVYRSVP